MAISPVTLPISAFPKAAQPSIGALNRWMRDISGLQGALQNPISAARSDATVVRQATPQVSLDRVTPTPTAGGTGSATVVTGTPALTFGTVNTNGSTSTVISINASLAIFGSQVGRPVASVGTAGTSAFAARADHVHGFSLSDFLPVGSTSIRQYLEYGSSAAPVWATEGLEKSMLIETPTATDDLTWWHTPEKVQVTEIRGVLMGGSVTTWTYDVKYADDRSAGGTSLLGSSATLTGTTTGVTAGLSSGTTVPALNYIWIEGSSGGGTGTVHLSMKYQRVN